MSKSPLARPPIQSEASQVFSQPVGVVLDLAIPAGRRVELAARFGQRRRLAADPNHEGQLDTVEQVQLLQCLGPKDRGDEAIMICRISRG